MNCEQTANLIARNIEEGGLLRYDPNDIDAYLYHKWGILANPPIRKPFRVADVYFPILLRKLLRVEKRANPTMFYHLGLACLTREKYHLPVPFRYTAAELAEQALELYFHPDSGLWAHPYYARVTVNPESVVEKPGVFSMAMHYVARLDIFLLALWKQYGDPHILDTAIQSVEAAARHHNIQDLGDGRKAISYYYITNDNTLNISAEFLEAIADIPAERRSQELTDLAHGLLKMLLHEQNEDGSFYYVGKAHMEKYHIPKSIDCFHTGYTLNNLIHVYESGIFEGAEQAALLESCQRGMQYFLDVFFNSETGEALYAVDLPTHHVDAICYAEAIFALCSYLRNPSVSGEMKKRIQALLPKAVENMIRMVDPKDGSVPGEHVLGRDINLDSIRWGNGPVLQALFDVMALRQEGLLPA